MKWGVCIPRHGVPCPRMRTPRFGKKSPEQAVRGSPVTLLGSVNRSLLTILALALEAKHAVRGGEQGVVAADAHVHTGVNVRAALTDKNVAGLDELAVGALGAKALGLRVTAVLGGAAALLVGEELKTNTNHDRDHPFLRF